MKAKIFIGILFLVGIFVLLYPTISDYLNSRAQAQVVENYSDEVSRMQEAEMAKELQRARDYNENLARTIVIDPFTETLNQELSEDYQNILSVNNGQIGTIKIPKISVELPIYHGTSPEVLQKGVGHLQNTALPVGGAGTHVVLSGHRGLPEAKLFTDLDELIIGDKFYIEVLNETLAYQIDQIKTVLPDQTEALQPVDGEDYVTLVTCTPYAVNTHRLLVRGKRTAFTPEEKEEIKQQEETGGESDKNELLLLAGAGFATLVFFYLLFFGSGRRRKEGDVKDGK